MQITKSVYTVIEESLNGRINEIESATSELRSNIEVLVSDMLVAHNRGLDVPDVVFLEQINHINLLIEGIKQAATDIELYGGDTMVNMTNAAQALQAEWDAE